MAYFVARDATQEDTGFIVKSWIETLRASHEARAVDSVAFTKHHTGQINSILRRGSVSVRVAGPPDEAFTIYGFAVTEGAGKLHFVYVRSGWRKNGVASMLLKEFNIPECTHSQWSRDVHDWISKKYLGLRYVPTWAEVPNGSKESVTISRAQSAGHSHG